MAAKTYKCPNCGAYLEFDPDSQKWKCPFCSSILEDSQLGEEKPKEEKTQEHSADGNRVIYRCGNCGSEIVTDETTVATTCYYCHSPVVLESKFTDKWTPDLVLPFTLSKEIAVQKFMQWAKSKKYVPDAFFKEAEVRGMTGVYFPHFITECETNGSLTGTAQNVRTETDGKFITTYTDYYNVRREGTMRFRNILRPALKKANRKIIDGSHPFPLGNAKAFSQAYLTGFIAERRDIDSEQIMDSISEEVKRYSDNMLRATVKGYSSASVQTNASVTDTNHKYVLLPTWVLTYPNPDDPGDPYYYVMNGCTGTICGKLPVDKKKLRKHAFLVGLAVFAVGILISYFLI